MRLFLTAAVVFEPFVEGKRVCVRACAHYMYVYVCMDVCISSHFLAWTNDHRESSRRRVVPLSLSLSLALFVRFRCSPISWHRNTKEEEKEEMEREEEERREEKKARRVGRNGSVFSSFFSLRHQTPQPLASTRFAGANFCERGGNLKMKNWRFNERIENGERP